MRRVGSECGPFTSQLTLSARDHEPVEVSHSAGDARRLPRPTCLEDLRRSAAWRSSEGQDTERLWQLVLNSRSESTNRKYFLAWIRFKKWAEARKEDATVPLTWQAIANYLSDRSKTARSKSSLFADYYAIKWAHKIAGVSDSTDNDIVKQVLEGAKRGIPRSSSSKKFIPDSTLIWRILGRFGDTTANDRELQFAAMVVLAFLGFLRIEEILLLNTSDIGLEDTHVEVFINKSKTDQCKTGQKVVLGTPEGEASTILLRHRRAVLSREGSGCLFYLSFFKAGRGKKRRLTYAAAKDELKRNLSQLEINEKHFGCHCFRHAGVSTASNAGVPSQLFKKHGRWKSSAVDGYVHDSIKQKLRVTEALRRPGPPKLGGL